MSIVTIEEVKGVVKCSGTGSAEHVFNVKNATAEPLNVSVQILPDDPVKADWLSVEPPGEIALDVDTVTQITLKIQVPSDCAPATYGYRLRIYDPRSPGERYSEGERVYFEVAAPEQPKAPPQEKKKCKWCIPAAIAAAVVIVVGIVIAVVATPSRVKLPDFRTLEVEQAEAFLSQNAIHYKKKLREDQKATRSIIDQKPSAGSEVDPETVQVELWLAGAKVPPLEGKTFFDAIQKIAERGLAFNEKNMKTVTVADASKEGKVIEQNPKQNKLVARGTEVELSVGKKRTGWLLTAHQIQMIQANRAKMHMIRIPKTIRSVEPE